MSDSERRVFVNNGVSKCEISAELAKDLKIEYMEESRMASEPMGTISDFIEIPVTRGPELIIERGVDGTLHAYKNPDHMPVMQKECLVYVDSKKGTIEGY